jgi:ATP-dependent protease HslVU (ClpYQ) peptidase subunit
MTCIVGFIDKYKKQMWMGGDSAGVGGLDIRSRKDVKVFEKDGMLIGYTSSFRMGQLLRCKFRRPPLKEGQDVYEYMCTDFMDAIRSLFKSNGYARVENNEETIGVFLVAFKGRLFKIESDLQVGENNYPYDACGCGENYAISAVHMLVKYVRLGKDEEFVEIGLKCAAEFSAGVRSPFKILKMKY